MSLYVIYIVTLGREGPLRSRLYGDKSRVVLGHSTKDEPAHQRYFRCYRVTAINQVRKVGRARYYRLAGRFEPLPGPVYMDDLGVYWGVRQRNLWDTVRVRITPGVDKGWDERIAEYREWRDHAGDATEMVGKEKPSA